MFQQVFHILRDKWTTNKYKKNIDKTLSIISTATNMITIKRRCAFLPSTWRCLEIRRSPPDSWSCSPWLQSKTFGPLTNLQHCLVFVWDKRPVGPNNETVQVRGYFFRFEKKQIVWTLRVISCSERRKEKTRSVRNTLPRWDSSVQSLVWSRWPVSIWTNHYLVGFPFSSWWS